MNGPSLMHGAWLLPCQLDIVDHLYSSFLYYEHAQLLAKGVFSAHSDLYRPTNARKAQELQA